MSSARIYLDHAATSPLRPEARSAMAGCWALGPANSSSAHAEGRAARGLLAEARARVAALVGARAEEVFFTSGATEASNLAVRGAARARATAGRQIVSTRLEHAATKRACEALAAEGWRVTLLGADVFGRVDPRELARAVTRETAVASVIAAHNEIGTVQQLAALADAAHAAGALLHLDAVQAVGVMDPSTIPWDLLSLSAHKLGGPQGIGALVARGTPALAPVLVGGSQERGLRPGTVPVALAAGFGAAAVVALERRKEEAARLARLRDRLARLVLARLPGLRVVGAWSRSSHEALPHLLTLGVDGVHGDELVPALDEAGIAASSAAACLGSVRSHVLEAIGLPERTGVMRFSLGWSTLESEIEPAAERIAAAVQRLMAVPPFERRRRLIASRAAEAGVALTATHWQAAEAVFEFHSEVGVLPSARYLAGVLGNGTRLEHLFPEGLFTLASWLDLPVPQGGCRPAGV